ncbi:MAG TPA: RsmB/NOP family class I SAM-dependent RNA methyltransferase [Rhizomicrobium sp.]|nr:RsmB/NOP family class I SAM-dependent RNA methyltransferase [Rhizomicrobium sp.]
MTPAARLQMAIEILEGLDRTAQPVDRFLKSWFRSRRFAGSKDRRAIAERVFSVQRRRAHLAHRMGNENPRALVVASLLEEGENPAALFTGGYGPAPLTDEECRVIAAPLPPAPGWVQGEYPQWLEEELRRAFGDRLPEEMAALQQRAPVDLRVNTLKAKRPEVLEALKAEGFAASPTRYSPWGIRIPPGEGSAALTQSVLFQSGAFEFQDEAAQLASLLACARPGMRVLDLAAGAGGKSLALAAAMQDQGSLLAFDDNAERMAPLAERAGRAGIRCITVAGNRGGPAWGNGKFDLVFLDAPCSGTGTWRRQPELRWRLTAARLAELTRIQDWLLDDAARHTAPGGRLIYATCSLLPIENQDRVAAFLSRNPAFTAADLRQAWDGQPVPGLGADFRAAPQTTGTDGFYCAGLQKQG